MIFRHELPGNNCNERSWFRMSGRSWQMQDNLASARSLLGSEMRHFDMQLTKSRDRDGKKVVATYLVH